MPGLLARHDVMRACTAAGGSRFAVYDLENHQGTPVYVHAKVVIVDDVWAMVGSDNLNRRSWSHNSELSIGVLDAELDAREPADPNSSPPGTKLAGPVRDPRAECHRTGPATPPPRSGYGLRGCTGSSTTQTAAPARPGSTGDSYHRWTVLLTTANAALPGSPVRHPSCRSMANGRPFVVMAGIGFDAEMIDGADERLKNQRGLGRLCALCAAASP